MIKSLFLSAFICSSAMAYVPTVESLLRHGSNPDVTVNGVSISMVVRKISATPKAATAAPADVSLLNEAKEEDFYKLFFTKVGDGVLKVAQSRYSKGTYTEDTLIEKKYYPNFGAYTIKGTAEDSERGIFMSMLQSIIYNDGAFPVNYLKTLGVPVTLNNEMINREKIEYLAKYKQYLITINKNRNAKKTEVNPLRPDDAVARDKVDKIMQESMYTNSNQVALSREAGNMAWLITAGNFNGVVSYKERDLLRVNFKSDLGEYEIIYKDYWLANGSHSIPRFILIKDYKGENYQVELTNLRHYNEKEADLVARLKKWDELLKGKESFEPKPPFLF